MNEASPKHKIQQRVPLGTRKNFGNRRGVTAVEFAFVFPIIMTIFIGTIAVTQAFFIRDMAQLAAYEGARQGTLLNATNDDVEDRVQAVLQTMRLQDCEITISPASLSNSTKEVEVSVVVSMSSNSWVTGPFLPSDWRIGSSVSLRKTDEN